jgi:hypothetical protein
MQLANFPKSWSKPAVSRGVSGVNYTMYKVGIAYSNHAGKMTEHAGKMTKHAGKMTKHAGK